MSRVLNTLKNRLLLQEMPLEAHIFNLLCFVGFFAVLGAAVIRGLWLSENILTFIYLLAVAALLGLGLLVMHRFQVRRGIIIMMLALVLNILFPLIFFTSGGIYSGMTAYFVLSLALFFVLLSGWACFIAVLWHIIAALSCYYLSYTHPELVSPLGPGYKAHVDCVFAIALSGLIPCLLIKAQTDAYIAEKLKAQSASKARSDFLANMSHEIRTPLNAIIGISEMELRTAGGETKDSLKKMHDSGVTLLNIINDILDISKMESGNFQIFPDKYDFASLVLDAVSLSVARNSGRPVEFKVLVDENIPDSLFGDEAAVKQIMNNILSNAFKYTENGSVTLHIRGEAAPGGGSIKLFISVRDTGMGIRSQDLEKIFSDYSKLDMQATAVEGIGLGLPISRKLAQMMGGSIEVRSELGKGSEFTAIIPQGIAKSTPIGAQIAARLAEAPGLMSGRDGLEPRPGFSGKVLVVDDMSINLDIAQSLLEDCGLEADTATSGKEALELLRSGERRYSLIFMDHMMPEMNGSETVRAIRALGGAAATVPIIGLTARGRGEGTGDSFLSDIQDIVPKPIDAAQLAKVLEKWLK